MLGRDPEWYRRPGPHNQTPEEFAKRLKSAVTTMIICAIFAFIGFITVAWHIYQWIFH